MDGYLLQRVRAAFPEVSDPMVVRAINEGLGVADDTISGTWFLQNAAGSDARGFVRRAAVLGMLNEYAVRGDLPFETEFERQTRGNWHWLNMTARGVLGHVVKTDGALNFPKDGPAKRDKRITNQGDFFVMPKLVPIEEIVTPDSDVYAWLSYGCDKLGNVTHAIWGVPAADDDVYMAYADILASALQQVDFMPKENVVEPPIRVALKEQIIESLRNAKETEDDAESEGQ